MTKIRIQFIVSVVLFAAILVTLAVFLAVTTARIAKYNRQEEIANNIERSAREMGYIANSYIIYGESQQAARWELTFDTISANLSSLDKIGPEEQVVVNSIQANLARLKVIFAEVSSTIERNSRTPGFFDQSFIQVSWSRMEVQNQAVVFDASRLFIIFDDRLDEARQTSTTLLLVLVGVFAVYIFSNYLLLFRRTLKSISELGAGTRVIGPAILTTAFR